MATATIVINGTTGNLIEKFSTLPSVITLSNLDDTGVNLHAWELLSVPPGSTASLTGDSTPTTQFTADIEGTYLVELSVNGGGATKTILDAEVDRKLYGVSSKNCEYRIPAGFEEKETNLGWTDEMYQMLIAVDRLQGGANRIVALNDSGVTITKGQAVIASIPDSSGIPTIEKAENISVLEEKLLYVADSNSDNEDTILDGELCYILGPGYMNYLDISNTYPGTHSSGYPYPISIDPENAGQFKFSNRKPVGMAFETLEGLVGNYNFQQVRKEYEDVSVASPYITELDVSNYADKITRIDTTSNDQVVILPLMRYEQQDGWPVYLKNSGSGNMTVKVWEKDYTSSLVSIVNASTDYIIVLKTDLPDFFETGELQGGLFTVQNSGVTIEEDATLVSGGMTSCNAAGATGTTHWKIQATGAFSNAVDNTWMLKYLQDAAFIEGALKFKEYTANQFVVYRWLQISSTPADWLWEIESAISAGSVSSTVVLAADPDENDDADDTNGNGAFAVGDRITNSVSGESFICKDSTATAAKWIPVSAILNSQSGHKNVYISARDGIGDYSLLSAATAAETDAGTVFTIEGGDYSETTDINFVGVGQEFRTTGVVSIENNGGIFKVVNINDIKGSGYIKLSGTGDSTATNRMIDIYSQGAKMKNLTFEIDPPTANASATYRLVGFIGEDADFPLVIFNPATITNSLGSNVNIDLATVRSNYNSTFDIRASGVVVESSAGSSSVIFSICRSDTLKASNVNVMASAIEMTGTDTGKESIAYRAFATTVSRNKITVKADNSSVAYEMSRGVVLYGLSNGPTHNTILIEAYNTSIGVELDEADFTTIIGNIEASANSVTQTGAAGRRNTVIGTSNVTYTRTSATTLNVAGFNSP